MTVDREANLYDVVGVPRDATAEDVRRAYRAKALQLHPDSRLQREGGATMSGDSGVTFAALQRAYEVLSDEVLRAAYDSDLREHDRQRQRPRVDRDEAQAFRASPYAQSLVQQAVSAGTSDAVWNAMFTVGPRGDVQRRRPTAARRVAAPDRPILRPSSHQSQRGGPGGPSTPTASSAQGSPALWSRGRPSSSSATGMLSGDEGWTPAGHHAEAWRGGSVAAQQSTAARQMLMRRQMLASSSPNSASAGASPHGLSSSTAPQATAEVPPPTPAASNPAMPASSLPLRPQSQQQARRMETGTPGQASTTTSASVARPTTSSSAARSVAKPYNLAYAKTLEIFFRQGEGHNSTPAPLSRGAMSFTGGGGRDFVRAGLPPLHQRPSTRQ